MTIDSIIAEVDALAATPLGSDRLGYRSLAMLVAEIKRLRETIEFARTQTGYEARMCPLCHYENGVLIGPCSLHAEIKRLRALLDEKCE
jgi:hypothetical protein